MIYMLEYFDLVMDPYWLANMCSRTIGLFCHWNVHPLSTHTLQRLCGYIYMSLIYLKVSESWMITNCISYKNDIWPLIHRIGRTCTTSCFPYSEYMDATTPCSFWLQVLVYVLFRSWCVDQNMLRNPHPQPRARVMVRMNPTNSLSAQMPLV